MENQSLQDFQDLCTFESFTSFWHYYGYGVDQQELIDREFKRIKGITYLDHAGATLFPESQIKGFHEDIARNVYGNPHSHNPSSRLTHDTVESVRYRILEHFNTCPEEYSVIFTSGCTAALKLVADSFPWKSLSTEGPGSQFCYLTDNHTSVVGIRGVTALQGAGTVPVQPHEVEARAKNPQTSTNGDQDCSTPHLFCYPAQSNFSGRKYPLSYVKGIQSQQLYPACEHPGRWFVLLDAACFVSCSPLDLKKYPADFVPISFYKMFGFPTGLGALLVRNEAAGFLRKSYFGGGTAAAYLVEENYFVPKPNVVSRFEDGTISFLDIISLHHGFETLKKLTGSVLNIQLHTFGLARYTFIVLSCLRHSNGKPVAQIHCDNEFQNIAEQGAILNFNLLDCQGRTVGYSQVDKMASLFNIHIRTGCFCNTGACQRYLGISNQNVKSNLQAGHVCGDNIDLVEGRPTGSLRVSFGYMSSFEECQNFLRFIVNCFVDKPLILDQERLGRLKSASPMESSASYYSTSIPNSHLGHENGQVITSSGVKETLSEDDLSKEGKNNDNYHTLTNLFIYPVKSCASFEVTEWPLGPQGLLYDRLWMVVNENGVCLNQKREPKLCLIQPVICLASNTLRLEVSGMEPVTIPLETSLENSDLRSSQSKVCGDRVQTVECGEEVSAWLSKFLEKPCRLIRQRPDFLRDMKIGQKGDCCPTALSLVNEAQFLLINRASVSFLQERIDNRQDSDNEAICIDMEQLIQRFRPNLVISGQEPFAEEDWSHLIVGGTQFQVMGRCGRCQMIGVDQKSATRTQEPLRSLSECRSGKVTFGVYLAQQSMRYSTAVPVLSVGDLVIPQLSESAD
ncbi:molybdenum cofactor sulfurase isoform X2 [Myxocyprinus asiaticus]|uniref:molybdenum cofactor sulfurase isoform X2 n=1 Tax=Myxocyprinus asiaticus TaxID=70543 RepID=UPI002223DE85|nr:molybdenum cofactor sulfurase isoform X2 [Myxocyprinus asiaticus]